MLCLALAGAVLAQATPGQASPGQTSRAQVLPPVPPVPPPPAAAWVLVDADTGAVLEGANARTPLPPASLTKLVTALAVVSAMPPSATVLVTPRAAAMPASRVGMQTGQIWSLDEAMHSLVLISANDAAMALAETAGRDAESFATSLRAVGLHLGMRDQPVLKDPSGLDGPEGVGGGNLVSATDLAIAARAALREPRIASVWGVREYAFPGPDGLPRRLVNHNKLLWSYPGTVGGKTGYTRRAGNCFLAVASRGGRTLITVLLDSRDHYGAARALLDRGFATPSPALPYDRLPDLRPLPRAEATAGVSTVELDESSRPPTVTVATALPVSRSVPAVSAGLSLTLVTAMLVVLTARRRVRRAGARAAG